jgi:hypothetical protein
LEDAPAVVEEFYPDPDGGDNQEGSPAVAPKGIHAKLERRLQQSGIREATS